jgi:hypothetical protein
MHRKEGRLRLCLRGLPCDCTNGNSPLVNHQACRAPAAATAAAIADAIATHLLLDGS